MYLNNSKIRILGLYFRLMILKHRMCMNIRVLSMTKFYIAWNDKEYHENRRFRSCGYNKRPDTGA